MSEEDGGKGGEETRRETNLVRSRIERANVAEESKSDLTSGSRVSNPLPGFGTEFEVA